VKVGLVTTSRADWGIYTSVATAIGADPELDLRIYAGGSHLVAAYGRTASEITGAGFSVAAEVECLLASDSPEAVAKSTALAVAGFAQLYSRERPDLIVVLGDRFEMHAAALAAVPFVIPIAHIHGGEVTEGAMDEALRHGITKMAHLHFVSTEVYAARVRQLGEEGWRVHVVGAPSLDGISEIPALDAAVFHEKHGVDLPERYILATFHPATLQWRVAREQVAEVLDALESVAMPVLFTMPNADTANAAIRTAIIERTRRCAARWQTVESLGRAGYLSALRRASAVVGNSSSGIIEAASFRVPVVDIGDRQRGRVAGANVMRVGVDSRAIEAAIRRVLSPEFAASLTGLENPYYAGGAGRRIAQVLSSADRSSLLAKRFVDIQGSM